MKRLPRLFALLNLLVFLFFILLILSMGVLVAFVTTSGMFALGSVIIVTSFISTYHYWHYYIQKRLNGIGVLYKTSMIIAHINLLFGLGLLFLLLKGQ